jgi:hypothetical protein
MPIVNESILLQATTAYRNGEYTSIRAYADAFSVSYSTLSYRLSGRVSRSTAHESKQILSAAEEKALVKWITRLSTVGCPITPPLTRDLAEEIQKRRVALSPLKRPYPPIGKRWLDRFRKRYPIISTISSRKIGACRFDALSYPTISAYFTALSDLFIENSYPPDAVFNVDESGFALGDILSSKVLINKEDTRGFKKIPGRQEWITAIECIGASGVALPPLLIFKAKHTNTAWIPRSTPVRWKFSTSNSGWTSDNHAYEWLTTLFDPETRRNDEKRRLLILDGHGSHLTARFIAFCLDARIDLVCLPPHTSHILQPLDVGLFGPLKRALAREFDPLFRLDTRRIPRVEWTAAFIRARENAFTPSNIRSSFRATGIYPISPITILSTLKMPSPSLTTTPPPIETTSDLDLTLLNSSPPTGTELRQATSLINKVVNESNIASPAKRYISRAGAALERTHSENLLLRKENAEARTLLRVRKERKTGKRVAIKGKFVFNTQEILEVVEKAEAEAAKKKAKKKRTVGSRTSEIESEVDEAPEDSSSDSDGDCIIVAARR